MKPRILLRTHYQVDEPAIISLLVSHCTSPVRSDYAERVAACLDSELQHVGKEFNKAAGKYAVDLARDLFLLTSNLVWTDLAQVLVLASTAGVPWRQELSIGERLVFFRLFLQADGAGMLFIARALIDNRALPSAEKSWNDIANEMVVAVYSEYLEHTSDPAHRLELRQVLDRRRTRPYRGKSGAHQMFVHLQTLHRLGLLNREGQGVSRRYTLNADASEDVGLPQLLAMIRSVDRLERCIDDWVQVAAAVFKNQLPAASQRQASLDDEELSHRVRITYDKLEATGIAQCTIRSIAETIQVGLLTSGVGVLRRDTFYAALDRIRRRYPRDVRLHVDQAGRPTFLKLADGFARDLAPASPSS